MSGLSPLSLSDSKTLCYKHFAAVVEPANLKTLSITILCIKALSITTLETVKLCVVYAEYYIKIEIANRHKFTSLLSYGFSYYCNKLLSTVHCS